VPDLVAVHDRLKSILAPYRDRLAVTIALQPAVVEAMLAARPRR
jgi:hypothetical protein